MNPIPVIVMPFSLQQIVDGVGNGRILKGVKVVALNAKSDDQVLFGKYAGTEVKLEGEELLVMREGDIMAVLEE